MDMCNGPVHTSILVGTYHTRAGVYAPDHFMNFHLYSLSSFEIRHDVTYGRLHILGELSLNAVVYGIAAKHSSGYSSEICSLPLVTSHPISKLDTEYASTLLAWSHQAHVYPHEKKRNK